VGTRNAAASSAPTSIATGDGIADGVGIRLRDGFGWVDEDGDGINDNGADPKGIGVNNRWGCSYVNGYQRQEQNQYQEQNQEQEEEQNQNQNADQEQEQNQNQNGDSSGSNSGGGGK
jgi:hypothetical protein